MVNAYRMNIKYPKYSPVLFGGSYAKKILTTQRANLIAYWPLWEASGAVAYNLEGTAARNGAYTGVTLGQPGIGDGRTSPFFDGANDYVNVQTASLAGAFNGLEGSFMLWFLPDAASHNDATLRRMLLLHIDASNSLILAHTGVNSNVQMDYKAGGTAVVSAITYAALPTTWQHIAYTWSDTANQSLFYVNGSLDETETPIGAWVGALTTSLIGASSVTPTNPHLGKLAHVAIWTTPLSATEIVKLATV